MPLSTYDKYTMPFIKPRGRHSKWESFVFVACKVLPEYQAQQSQSARNRSNVSGTKIFDKHDVIETCYHFLAQKIDLHFCDDPGGE